MNLTPNQLHILQHSLGCDQHGRTQHLRCDEGDGCFGYYRNRYVSDPIPDLLALVEIGLMKDWGVSQICGGNHIFTVTEAGISAMLEQSPKPPKVSRHRSRWLQWLESADAYYPMKFQDWLNRRLYDDEKARAYWR